MIITCVEYGGFEILTIFSGLISVQANAAMTMVLNTNVIFFMLPQALSFSTTTIVGTTIGQMNSKLAKQQSRYIISISMGLASIMGLVLYVFRYQFAKFYTQDEVLVEMAANTFKISAFSHFVDFLYGVQQGPIRALTKFNHAVIGCVIAFYFIAIPMGWYLGLS